MKKTSFNQRLERLLSSGSCPPLSYPEQVLDDIRDRKCHIVKVIGNDQQPDYAYSIGLWHHFNHPEVIAFGPPDPVGEKLIRDIQTLVKVGQPPPIQQALGLPVQNGPAHLQPIADEQWIRHFLNGADWFYDRESFPVLELCWMSPQG
ncbi:MAG: DUF4262 domain-containing protein [Thermosynechococcaceae cyanobacterium]